MAVFRRGAGNAPSWCELQDFEIGELGQGGEVAGVRAAPRERILVTAGITQLVGEGFSQIVKAGQFHDLPSDCDRWCLRGTTPDAGYVHFTGRWGSELGGCGVFSLENVAEPEREPPSGRKGDPFTYRKLTRFDRHYHDCDEYWLLLEGSVLAVLDETIHRLEAGHCLAIGMGHHHDLAEVLSPMRAVFLETTLEGRKRVGHLWEHTHGRAEPQMERV